MASSDFEMLQVVSVPCELTRIMGSRESDDYTYQPMAYEDFITYFTSQSPSYESRSVQHMLFAVRIVCVYMFGACDHVACVCCPRL